MAKKQQTRYVDGFVLVIPKKNVAQYRKMAREGKEAWMRHGALSYKECMLDDKKPPYVTMPFMKMVKAKPSETVWFSYIEFKSKAHRNQVNKKVMAEMNEKYADEKDASMPFDMNNMSYGGFTVVVSN